MWEICMPIFRPLAPLVWEENEVTDGRTNLMPFFGWKHNEISKLPPLLSICLARAVCDIIVKNKIIQNCQKYQKLI